MREKMPTKKKRKFTETDTPGQSSLTPPPTTSTTKTATKTLNLSEGQLQIIPAQTQTHHQEGPSNMGSSESESEEEEVRRRKKKKKPVKTWGESLKKRRFICERGIDSDGIPFTCLKRVVEWLRNLGITKWFEIGQRYLPEVCVKFYVNCRFVSSYRLESKVRGKNIVVTPDSIASWLGCVRPSVDAVQFPKEGYPSLSGMELAKEVCVDPAKYKGQGNFPVGLLETDIALLNKVWHSNIRPSGKEKLPSVMEVQWLYEIRRGAVVDIPVVIWDKMKNFVTNQNSQASLPFCWFITSIVELAGVKMRKEEKYEFPSPGRITVMTEKQIKAHTVAPPLLTVDDDEDVDPEGTTGPNAAHTTAAHDPIPDTTPTDTQAADPTVSAGTTTAPHRTTLRGIFSDDTEAGGPSSSGVPDVSDLLGQIFDCLQRMETGQERIEKRQDDIEKEMDKEMKRRKEFDKAFLGSLGQIVLRQELLDKKVLMIHGMVSTIVPPAVPTTSTATTPPTTVQTTTSPSVLLSPLPIVPIPSALRKAFEGLQSDSTTVTATRGEGELSRGVEQHSPPPVPVVTSEGDTSVGVPVVPADTAAVSTTVIPTVVAVVSEALAVDIVAPDPVLTVIPPAPESTVDAETTARITTEVVEQHIEEDSEGDSSSSSSSGDLDMESASEDSVERERRLEMDEAEQRERERRLREFEDDPKAPDYHPSQDD